MIPCSVLAPTSITVPPGDMAAPSVGGVSLISVGVVVGESAEPEALLCCVITQASRRSCSVSSFSHCCNLEAFIERVFKSSQGLLRTSIGALKVSL